MKKVTMQDIADQVGVSRMTVSKCFQDSDDISVEMKEKILAVAGKLGYIYCKQNRYHVVVLVPEIFLDKTEDFYSGLYKRLIEISGLNNIVLSLVVVKQADEDGTGCDYSFQKQDAVIALGQLSKNIVQGIIGCGIPVICVDFSYRNLKVDTISCNNFHASYNATSFLIEKGHKSIGFVGSLNATNSINDRYLGYYKAILENRLTLREEFCIPDRDKNGQLIELNLPDQLPSSFVCNNDHVAYLLIRRLIKMGYQVPEDISVVGFDDVIYSSISDPPITTMHVTRKYMAEQAIKLLLRRIKTPAAEIRNISVECTMIERESVREYSGS